MHLSTVQVYGTNDCFSLFCEFILVLAAWGSRSQSQLHPLQHRERSEVALSSCVPRCHPSAASRCFGACAQDGESHHGTGWPQPHWDWGQASLWAGQGTSPCPLPPPGQTRRTQLAPVRNTPEPSCRTAASNTSTSLLTRCGLHLGSFYFQAHCWSCFHRWHRAGRSPPPRRQAKGTPLRVINAAGGFLSSRKQQAITDIQPHFSQLDPSTQLQLPGGRWQQAAFLCSGTTQTCADGDTDLPARTSCCLTL